MTSSGLHLSRQQFFPLIHSCNEINQATANPRSPISRFGSCDVASACSRNMTRVFFYLGSGSPVMMSFTHIMQKPLEMSMRGLQRRLCDIRSQQLSVRLQLLLRDLKQNLIKVLALIEQALRRAQGPTLCLSCITVTCQSQRLATNFLKNKYTQDIWQHLPLLWRYLQNH